MTRKFVILKSLSTGQTFYSLTADRPEDELIRLGTGEVAYKVLGYADTNHEAQTFLFGKYFADRELEKRKERGEEE